MSEANIKKAGVFGNNVYRLLMSVSVLTLLFNGGAWKQGIENDIEEKGFEDAQKKFEWQERVLNNTEHSLNKEIHITPEQMRQIKAEQETFKANQAEILDAINTLDKRIQWNFNQLQNK